ncbi:DUF2085 domain-containing protein [Flavobacterium sp. F-65]|jgi:uncharacterized membrane protein|uniref:DUF2085 domain-containing protein n=1 Tax=Flavobacterium pisciphilum TaxID=2893755 RepID=A0ABS8MSX9_9FLAO|nr:DUF2085 domain-containing protein [Flavobacterium sp. F-65]MCC9071885.1 DUF2085 domain-containing protein [Flavobacterium sp. F-65]
MSKIEFVSCHRLPNRSFFYKGRQFPICARCTGIYVGYFIFIPLLWFMKINIYWALLSILPTIIDGLTQAYYNRESNNFLRFSTGILAGYGVAGISDFIAYWTVKLSKYIIFFINN